MSIPVEAPVWLLMISNARPHKNFKWNICSWAGHEREMRQRKSFTFSALRFRGIRKVYRLIIPSYLKRKLRSIFSGCVAYLWEPRGLGFAGPAAIYFFPYYPLPQDLVPGDFDADDTIAEKNAPVQPPKVTALPGAIANPIDEAAKAVLK